MSTLKRSGFGLSAALLAATLMIGCFEMPGDDDPSNRPDAEVEDPVEAPALSSISLTTLRVGDPVSFTGENFVDDHRAMTLLQFTGTYFRSDGLEEDVDFTIEPEVLSETQVSWKFGPYQVPFCSTGDKTGTFWGDIRAINVLKEGGELLQEGTLGVEIQVLPSIVVRSFQPAMADCVSHSDMVLDHVPYQLEVEAIGFQPVDFKYTISPGALMSPDTTQDASSEPTIVTHSANGSWDRLGDQEYFNFAPVPFGVHGYDTWVKIEARAVGGETHSYLLPLTVRQPLVARYAGQVEVAQIYDAVPVSGCIYGDETGRSVQYTETHEEVRERELGTSYSTGWEQSYTESHTATYGEGGAEANRVGFSTTDGMTFGWNVNTEVSGEVGFQGLAKVGFSVGMGISFEQSHSETVSGDHTVSSNWNYSEAATESQTASETVTQEGSEILRVRSSESESLNYAAELLPMKYGVFYRQTTRLVRKVEIVAYDLCGNWTVVGSMMLSDYTWAPDLAMGDTCPPFPESNLPKAECFISPCE